MKHKKLFTGFFAFFGILLLILDSKTAMKGAQEGVDLCINTVIPSLFPFLLLTSYLNDSLNSANLSTMKWIRTLFRLPNHAGPILISGFLGGYPVGAKSISQAYSHRQLSKQDAERMLAFCNNAGPAFLFGMIFQMFSAKWMVWALWGIHILSAIITSRMLFIEKVSCISENTQVFEHQSLLKNTVIVMSVICGWVVFFRVLIAILNRWFFWIFPKEIQILLIGSLELTNGCCMLNQIEAESLRFILCSIMLAAGGLCVTMQTSTVTQGLSLRYYFFGKTLQCIFSLILSSLVIHQHWLVAVALSISLLYFPANAQKKCRNSVVIGV